MGARAPRSNLARNEYIYHPRSNAPPLSLHTSPVPPIPILKRPSVLTLSQIYCRLGRRGREPRRGAGSDALEAEKRTEHALVTIPPEQFAQVELDHLARCCYPCPVEVQRLVPWDRHTWSIHSPRAG